MLGRALRLATVALVAFATLASEARATTVYGFYEIEIRDELSGVNVVDRAGDRNDITITVKRRILVRERGPGPLQALGNCRQDSAKLVSCPRDDAGDLRVSLGGGSDSARVDASRIYFSAAIGGGAGRDRLELTGGSAALYGDAGRDTLLGGPHRDFLAGGPDADRLYGRHGNDYLTGDGWQYEHDAGPSDDVLDGGRGHDIASWIASRDRVVVDLLNGRGGRRNEHDRLRSIEGAETGFGHDVLRGGRNRNVLIGGPGPDQLLGQDGDDDIDAGIAAPFGYGGNPDGAVDRIDCGRGRDLVRHVGVHHVGRGDATDPIPQDCERMRVDSRIVAVPRLMLGADRVRVEIDCYISEAACERQVVMRSRGQELGRSATRKTNAVRFVLPVHLRRPLGPGAPVVVQIHGRNFYEGGYPPDPYEFEYRLVRPRAGFRAR